MIRDSLENESFSAKSMLVWKCPRCDRQTLQMRKGTRSREESRKSRDAVSQTGWDPDWIHGIFSALVECAASGCREVISVAGTYGTEHVHPDEYEERFYPRFFCPPIPLIDVPVGTPRSVRDILDEAFAVFWVSNGGCANRLRVLVERILDAKRVPKTKVGKGGKRKRMCAHDRIKLLRGRQKDIGEALLALKFLGNEGSHESKLIKEDVLDAFQIVEHVLSKLYDKSRVETAKIIEDVNKRRGARRRPSVDRPSVT